MKKVLIVIVVLAVLGGGFWFLRSQRSLLEEPGKAAAAAYGEITLPITASCVAKEPRRVNILPEASGTIIEIPVSEGDTVKKGDLLILIDKIDEERAYKQAELQVQRAKDSLARLKLQAEFLEKDLPNKIRRAEAAVETGRWEYKQAEFNFKRIERLYEEGQETELQYIRAQTQKYGALARLSTAEENLETAKLGHLEVERAKAEVRVAEADLATAEERLRDARERLDETEIRSPIDGRVVRIAASVGLVVASTTRSFAVASSLMQLVDTSEVVVEAQVDEADIDRVNELWNAGRLETIAREPSDPTTTSPEELAPDEVLVKFDALRGKQFIGRIVDIAQEPKDIANIITYDVRVVLNPREDLRRIRLGMQGTVEFRPNHAEGLCIPYAAVHRKGPGEFIAFVPTDEALREEEEISIEVGLSDGVNVIVHSGLNEGDKVYTKRPRRIDRDKESEGEE